MRRYALLPAAVGLAFAAVTGLSRTDTGPPPKPDPYAGLIRQLGHDRFDKREEASRALEAAGEEVIDALHRAASDRDPEVRRRAKLLLEVVLPGARKSKSLGLELKLIDPGDFEMGSHGAEFSRRADETQHRVRVTRPFYLGKYEVTQDEYQKVMKATPSWFAGTGGGKDKVAGHAIGRFPVERVTWFDAVEFCNRLSRQDGYEPFYVLDEVRREDGAIKGAKVTVAGGTGYRLPTEAEWEYACRAGSGTAWHIGNATKSGTVNCKPLLVASGYGSSLKWPDLARTAQVGSYPPNAWDLHDMHGNVGEWCGDWYDKDYYAKSPKDDPQGPDAGTHRVLRGGSWLVSEGSCRSASRFFHAPDEVNYYGGFRVARRP